MSTLRITRCSLHSISLSPLSCLPVFALLYVTLFFCVPSIAQLCFFAAPLLSLIRLFISYLIYSRPPSCLKQFSFQLTCIREIPSSNPRQNTKYSERFPGFAHYLQRISISAMIVPFLTLSRSLGTTTLLFGAVQSEPLIAESNEPQSIRIYVILPFESRFIYAESNDIQQTQ